MTIAMFPAFLLGIVSGIIVSVIVSAVAAVVTIRAIETKLEFHKEAIDRIAGLVEGLPCRAPHCKRS